MFHLGIYININLRFRLINNCILFLGTLNLFDKFEALFKINNDLID